MQKTCLNDPWPLRASVKLCDPTLLKGKLNGIVTSYPTPVTAEITWQELWEGEKLEKPGGSIKTNDEGGTASYKGFAVDTPFDTFPLSRLVFTGFVSRHVSDFVREFGDRTEGFDEYVAYCGRRNMKHAITGRGSALANPYTLEDVAEELDKKKGDAAVLKEVCVRYKKLMGDLLRFKLGKPSPDPDVLRIDHEGAWQELLRMVQAHKAGRKIVTLCWCQGQCHTYSIHRTVLFLASKRNLPGVEP